MNAYVHKSNINCPHSYPAEKLIHIKIKSIFMIINTQILVVNRFFDIDLQGKFEMIIEGF